MGWGLPCVATAVAPTGRVRHQTPTAIKKTSPLLLLLLTSSLVPALAQNLTNAGSTITLTSGAILTVPGTIENLAGATLSNEGTVRVGGDLNNAGTLASTAGTVVFAGTADQTLTPGTGTTLSNIEVNNTGAAGNNRVLLPADLTATGQVNLVSGLLRTAVGATLLLPNGATLTGEAPGRYVQGNVRVERANVNGSTAVDFGHGFVLAPNSNALGAVRVTRSAGLQTAGVSYGQNPGNTAQHGIDRIWTVAPDNQPTAPVDLTFSWPSDDDFGLSFGQGQVWRMPDNQTAWQRVGPLANASTSATTRSLTVSSPGLSRWTVSDQNNPLPVELTAFTAERQGPDALLRWTTASEKDNDRFEVESSVDGRRYQRIGTVPGHSSTTQPQAYALTDPALARYAALLVYYRLRQVDTDGTATYSPVRTVTVPAEARLAFSVYPNPTRAAATVLGAAAGASVDVLDAVGRRVASTTTDANGTAQLTLPAGLAAGVYVVRSGNLVRRLTVE